MPYAGENTHVLQLGRYLAHHLTGDLKGAYIHGSLGSYEEIAYSDLDALVILNHQAFRSPERLAQVARVLRKARAFMFDYDPLQHHGWFVLTEADLARHCEAYFPAALFAHAKSLIPGQGETFTFAVRDSTVELREAFHAVAANVARQLAGGSFPDDLYALKNLLSQFMLLPSLYVQVRDGEGVWKAHSFGRARGDFSDAEWDSMETASHIRQAWRYRLPGVQRRLMASPRPWGRHLRKRLPTPIPRPIAVLLSPDFLAGMAGLVARMQQRVGRGAS